MRVILLEKVEKLGGLGDMVTVKPGYARNFLLPRKKALRATKENEARFAAERAKIEAASDAQKADAAKTAAKLEGSSIILVRAASEMGQLYGSATSRDIAAGISAGGKANITRNQVALNTAIKTLGLFPVKIILHPEVSVEVTVNIARSEDEAKQQQKLGRAIISDIAERERLEAAEADGADTMLDEDAMRNRARESDEDDSDSDGDDMTAGDDVEMVTAAPAPTDNDDDDADTADDDSAKPVAKKKKATAKKTATKAKAKTAKAPAKKAPVKKAPAKKKSTKKKA